MSTTTTARQSIFTAKKALRRAMKRKLDVLTPQEVSRQSQAVLDHVIKLGLLDRTAGSSRGGVSCYLSMQNGELNTDGLLKMILGQDILLYVPVIPTPSTPSTSTTSTIPSSISDMHFKRLYTFADLEKCNQNRDKWGIPDAGMIRRDTEGNEKQVEREDAATASPLRIIFTPGMAFDSSCRRLGHGKGYYDRYFERYKAFSKERGEERPLIAALALSEQILMNEAVPVTEDDEFVDVVIHPGGAIWRNGR